MYKSRLTPLIILVLCLSCACIADEVWTVQTISTDAWLPHDISFLLYGSILSLDNTYIYQPGGSSSHSYSIGLSGQWARCGTISEGSFIDDPYASFVICEHPVAGIPSSGWSERGFVTWLDDTPAGYTAPLVLGYNGTITVTHSWNFGTQSSTRGAGYTFAVDYVPETSSWAGVLCCLSGLGALMRRRRVV